jgi:hypothetical protein
MTSTPLPETGPAAHDEWAAVRQVYLDHLAEEGYRPSVDEDGDVHFKHEGGHYYITHNSDEGYLQVLFPNFWSIDSPEELQAAYRAVSVVNNGYKVVKFYVRADETNLHATAELFITSPHVAVLHLSRCLDVLTTAQRTFREEMNARVG